MFSCLCFLSANNAPKTKLMTNFFDLLVSYVENVLRWQSFQFFSKICCREKKHPREFVFVEKKISKAFFYCYWESRGDGHSLWKCISWRQSHPDLYYLAISWCVLASYACGGVILYYFAISFKKQFYHPKDFGRDPVDCCPCPCLSLLSCCLLML